MDKMFNIFRLIFSEKSFVEKAKEHDTEENKKLDRQPETVEARVAWKRKAIRNSFFLILSLSAIAYFSAAYINTNCPLSLGLIRIIRVISISVVAWALLAKLSNNVDTMWGRTLLEKTNESYFKQFYFLGFVFAVFSIFLEPTNA